MHKRIVIKIGTSVLTDKTADVQDAVLTHYAKECRRLIDDEYAPVFVTSGGVQIGRSQYPDISDKKVLASIGQARLLTRYHRAFSDEGLTIAQFLCSRPDIARPKLIGSFEHTLEILLKKKIVPIVNELLTCGIEAVQAVSCPDP